MRYDALIIGGSYAGLSAALPLARARRRILVVDGGQRRNRYAAHAHGFLTQDGTDPADIAAQGHAQVMAYPTVDWVHGQANQAERLPDGSFRVHLADGSVHEGLRLILATGVIDHLPDVPGLAERWGKRVFHCPYCHGYELQQGRIGVLAASPLAMHLALLLPDWGHTTLFLHDQPTSDADQHAQLAARGVTVQPGRVARIDGEMDVVLADGLVVPLDGLFTPTRLAVASPLAAQLGCAFDDGPYGSVIHTDPMKATTVPGVYACGDAARPGGSVALAVGDGAIAGAAAHQSLIFGIA